MSELYDLENLTLREIKALRTGLDHLPINGIDAFFVGTLQIKLNEQIIERSFSPLKHNKLFQLEHQYSYSYFFCSNVLFTQN